MTAFAGIRRLGFVLLAVGGVTAGVLTTAGYLISPDTVRSEVLSRIRDATGLDPKLGGKVSVSLFPKGSVTFSDVVLGDPRRPALTAERGREAGASMASAAVAAAAGTARSGIWVTPSS